MSHATRSRARQETPQQDTLVEQSQSEPFSGSKQMETPDNAVINLTHSTPAPHAHHSPHKIPVIHTENWTQRETKRETRNRNLAAVNGVVIPSKLPLGQLPDQGEKVQVISHSLYSCSICGRNFVRKGNVKVHMWPCVNRNGNPNGIRWDDAWNDRVNPIGSSSQDLNGQDLDPEETESETEPFEDNKTDKLQPADYSLLNSPSSSLQSRPFDSSHPFHLNPHPTPPSTSTLHQTSAAPSPMSSAPSRLPQHSHQPASPTFSQTTPQIASPPSTPYNPNLRMDILSNEALLLMVQAWQGAAQHVGEEYVTDHPQFQSVMHELLQRGIVDEDSNWLTDSEKVDLFARRAVG